MKLNDVPDLTIPPTLLADIQTVAEDEHRTAAEVVREALERYLAEWRKGARLPHGHHRLARRTPTEAAARLRERRTGNVLPEGVTIRDLMTHGRA